MVTKQGRKPRSLASESGAACVIGGNSMASDKGELYTTPQVDAKLFWMMKRASPNFYAKFLGFSYRFVSNKGA